MGEKLQVISKRVSYTGLFSVREIFKLIDDWLGQHGWDKIEASHTEVVTEKGKEIKISLEPEKKENDYVKYIIYIDIVLTEVEDVVVKKGKKNIPLNKGNVDISLDAKIVTDYDGKWVKSPIHLMIKAMYDKFVKKSEIDEFKAKLEKAVTHLNEQIKAHLNLFQYRK
ncbi:hypothetical protein KY326_02215 [Candidatus Woesearchaeota archaeon]|nr:hypothetical protein [Candidatus Woesearchaeota archaeon]